MKDRIKSLSQQREIGYVGWEFEGGKVEANAEANRLQILFEEKPDAATREELKSNGFRWSPKAEAWQRQLTDNAYRSADYIKAILPLSGERPSELLRAHIRQQKSASQEAPAPEPIYKVHTNPRSDSRENLCFLQAYIPQEDGKTQIGDVLYIGTPEKCRELMAQLNAGELTQGEVKELYAKAQEAGQDKDTFSIYQLMRGDETRDLRFEPYDRLQATGHSVDRANYELIYTAPLAPDTSLEDIYTRFNIDHPADFKGQMPFKVPPGTKIITEMAPTKSNDRILPITEETLPYFLRQFDLIERQKALIEASGGVYYDNKLFIAKPDGSPQRRDRMSANFGQLIRHLEMPHIRFHDLRHTAATNMHQLTGDFYTVGEILGHTLKGIGMSLGISTNLEAVTAQYVNVRLERKKAVLKTYHKALHPQKPAPDKGSEPKKAKKKSSEIEL